MTERFGCSYDDSCLSLVDSEARLWESLFHDSKNDSSGSPRKRSPRNGPPSPSPKNNEEQFRPSIEVLAQETIWSKTKDLNTILARFNESNVGTRKDGALIQNDAFRDYITSVLRCTSAENALAALKHSAPSEETEAVIRSINESGCGSPTLGPNNSQTNLILRHIPASLGFDLDDCEGFLLKKIPDMLDLRQWHATRNALVRAQMRCGPRMGIYWHVYKQRSQESLTKVRAYLEKMAHLRPFPVAAFCTELAVFEGLGGDEEDCKKYRKIGSQVDDLRKKLDFIAKDFSEVAFSKTLSQYRELAGPCRDVDKFEKMLEEEKTKRTLWDRCEKMLLSTDFSTQDFKHDLAAFKKLGGVSPLFESRLALETMLNSDPFSAAEYQLELKNYAWLGGTRPSLPEVGDVLPRLETALDRTPDTLELDKITRWKNILILHNENNEVVKRAQEILRIEGKRFFVRQRLAACKSALKTDDVDLSIFDEYRSAIEDARPFFSSAEIQAYQKECRETELRLALKKAHAVIAQYSTMDSLASLVEGRSILSIAHRVAVENNLPEEKSFLVYRRKIHNQCEDLKGRMRLFARIPPAKESLEVDGDTVLLVDDNDDEQSFTFDTVFGPQSDQKDVFSDVADLLQSALDGYRCTIFAYGQTGAGKTHTMLGNPDDVGIAPRAAHHLFNTLIPAANLSVEVYGSVYEIYRNQVVDCCKDQQLKAQEVVVGYDRVGGVVSTEGLTERQLCNARDMTDLINIGSKVRRVGTTAMNIHSSRSHLIVQLRIVSKRGEITSEGKMMFIDLAGSERLKKSALQQDATQEDAIQVNVSLTALMNVLQAAAENSAIIPYRNHVLTKVLRDALGGYAKTLMFVHLSPLTRDREETLQTCRWAEKAKQIDLRARPRSPGRSPYESSSSFLRTASRSPKAKLPLSFGFDRSPVTSPRNGVSPRRKPAYAFGVEGSPRKGILNPVSIERSPRNATSRSPRTNKLPLNLGCDL